MTENIVIGSTLRTHNDHRLYEKWGIYFLQKGVKVHIFGKTTVYKPDQSIQFHDSLTKGRILSPLYFFILLIKTNPSTIICTTFELLLVSSLYKIIKGSKSSLYYDVIENYSLNLKHQSNRPWLIKLLFVPHIKLREWLSRPFIKHYFYSDKIYTAQLNFLKSKSTYLPNYYSYPLSIQRKEKENSSIQVLIAGTISKDYGIEKGLQWFNELEKHNNNLSLLITGHQTSTFQKVTSTNICYQLEDNNVSHKKILEAIANCDMLLLPYNWTKSFDGCVPSKLYEALHFGTSVIIEESDHLNYFKKYSNVFFVSNLKDLKKIKLTQSKIDTSFNFKTLYSQLDRVFTK